MKCRSSELCNRSVVTLEVDATSLISTEIIAEINKTCDFMENINSGSILVIKLLGSQKPQNNQLMYKNVNIHTITKWEKALRRIELLDVVTIAVSEKECGLLALEILLTTDYRICTKNFNLYNVATLWPGMSLYRLANQLGTIVARKAALFGLHISANQAITLKLIDEAVDDTTLALAKFVSSIDSIETKDIAVRRQLLLDACNTSFEDALGTHLAACDRVLRCKQTDTFLI